MAPMAVLEQGRYHVFDSATYVYSAEVTQRAQLGGLPSPTQIG
jgi:hypothetical protein